MKVLSTLVTLCLLVGVATSEDGARILAAKNLLNEYLVEGKDLTVLYSIYNVGTRYVKMISTIIMPMMVLQLETLKSMMNWKDVRQKATI